MAEISAKLVAELRQKTGAGIMECKKALGKSDGDVQKAADWLRTQGVKAGTTERATKEGTIAIYQHSNGKIASMVELRCETDFVTRNADFQQLAKDLCLHVAGTPNPPIAVRREDIASEVIEKEMAILREQEDVKSKPANVQDKILEGRMRKFYEERVLLEQPFVKDDKVTIKALIEDKIKTIKENIQIGGFTRWVLGNDPILAVNKGLATSEE